MTDKLNKRSSIITEGPSRAPARAMMKTMGVTGKKKKKIKKRSSIITEGPSRAPARAMMKSMGLTDKEISRPMVGIANTWIETMPCNFHLRRLSEKIKQGVREAGG